MDWGVSVVGPGGIDTFVASLRTGTVVASLTTSARDLAGSEMADGWEHVRCGNV